MHESIPHPSNGSIKGLDMSTTAGANEFKRNVTSSRKQNSWFELPAPVRRLFDTFPLITYDQNALPQRVETKRNQNSLHIFTSEVGDSQTNLSLNPACLKWQAYLLVNKIPFSIVHANNHASPSGALPFILPPIKSKKDPQPQAIVSSKIYKWALTQGAREERIDLRLDVYMALIDVNIRNAWLFYLYLQDENFDAVAKKLYIQSTSSNLLVQAALAFQLKTAARDEVLRTKEFIDEQEVLHLADTAFKSLATFLGDDNFYSRNSLPGLFDLALFSYTYPLLALRKPLLDEASGGQFPTFRWKDQSLSNMFQKYQKLVDHQNRVLTLCTKH